MRIAKAIWLLIILLLLTAISGFAYLFITNHASVINLTVEQLHRPDLRQVLEQRYFTESDFTRLQRMGYSFIPILFGLLGFLIVLRKKIIAFINDAFSVLQKLILRVRESILSSSKPTKIILAVLLFLVLIRSVYYALHYYTQYDECWNYNYFLNNSPLNTLFAYNNYPLHNLLTYAFLTILPDNTLTMRLPNIILGLVNMLLVFSLVKKIFKREEIALVATALFAVLPTAVFYMLFARGVMLALLFTVGLLYFLFIKKIEDCSPAECAIVVLLSSLGTYAMISFPVLLIIFFLISTVRVLKNKDRKGLQKILLVGLASFLVTLILYLPILLGTGLNLGANSGYSFTGINWNTFIQKANFVARNQIGFYSGAYIFIGINILLLFFSQRRFIVIANLALLLIPFVFPIIFKMYFPARALGFQVFAYLFTLLIFLEILFHKTNKVVFMISSLALVIGFSYVSITHTFFTWSARQDKGAYEIARVFQEQNISSYYDESGAFQYFVPSILYHHKIANEQIRFFTIDKSSSRYTKPTDYNGNTFVIESSEYIPQNCNKVLYNYKDEDRDFTIYQKRK